MQPVMRYVVESAFDRLLRPDQATRNAAQAAQALSSSLRHREQVDRDVTGIADRAAGEPSH